MSESKLKFSPLGDNREIPAFLHAMFDRLTKVAKSRETVQDLRDKGKDLCLGDVGNFDDVYDAGREDGGVELARDLLKEFFGERVYERVMREP